MINKIEKIEDLLKKYECSDGNCVFYLRYGRQGTNGGCEHLKIRHYIEWNKLLNNFMQELRDILVDKKK